MNIVFTCPTVETERLILRPFRDADVEAYFAIHDTAEVRTSLHLPESIDRQEARKHMALWNGQWTLRNSGQWAVELAATGELIGRAGTHRPQRAGWPGLEVGWTFHPDHWGNGYATEAGRAAITWAFANHDVDELVSVILSENTASQAVATRLGFTWREDRILQPFVTLPHGIWTLPRPA